MVILHAIIAILAIVLLIILLKVDPVISLVIGAMYYGIAAGLGLEKTLTTIVEGFGSIMAEVGLLIGFGVLIGALLFTMGALQRFVELLLRLLGPRKLPYALAAALTAVFPSIYVDVQLVLASPLARNAAPALGRRGLGIMAGSVTAGILVGYVFVVPGLGTISIAGLLNIPLAQMLGIGLAVGVATVLLTVFVYSFLVNRGLWNPATDETGIVPDAEQDDSSEAGGTTTVRTRQPHLAVALSPVYVPLILIATGAILAAFNAANSVTDFLGDPVFALFLGLVIAYVLSQIFNGREKTNSSMEEGFSTTGQILLITGVGGSLGEVISATNLADVLGGLFTANSAAPVIVSVLIAWLIAAVLHLAIGSISVAAIAAAGIIGPILGQLDVSPIIIGLAIGSGALFALQVNSNFFWMFQTMMQVTTKGALKALTFVTALASVISLIIVCLLTPFF
ncbi:GntP family permease [Brevibacterium sp. RIT 803]|uniref:GntP family permease n=1 Tax=Brevibacterium sp. RIT 803 TaxID=2810210 RepID=UPI001951E67A|nr:GntP family permease [Brevibacterium sp. RIT 803]MBM6590768.1 GntP family permease [Brevibacterium sp. RIT 803]